TETLLSKTTRTCPNPLCGWCIEKNGGCDQIRHSRCRTQFCWKCGKTFVWKDFMSGMYSRERLRCVEASKGSRCIISD
ncbi:hypothetical protein K432DRAFT_293752, partial [Lepidopterella palustris CBS 459.81]